jgi:aarF domain-containing kinase
LNLTVSLCFRAVLVETFEVGVPLNDYLRTGALAGSVENRRLARLGLRAYLKMLLYDNFVHADLHPGNILVRKSPEGDAQLVFLDLGLVSHLSDTDWMNFKDLFKAIVEGNGKRGADLMVTRARGNKLSDSEHDKFVIEMDKIFSRVRQQKLAELNIGSFISEVMATLRKYRVKIESNFATLCVATVVLEGIGRQLDPEINILDQSVPFLFWSGKTTLEDRIVYVKEKMKDEVIEKGGLKLPDKTWPRRMWKFIKSVFQQD